MRDARTKEQRLAEALRGNLARRKARAREMGVEPAEQAPLGRRSTADELNAAKRVAARLGLGAIDPVVIKLAKHTTARLAPFPIVARIQSVAPPDQARGSLANELSIARYLAARDAPTVRPSINIDPGPHSEAGCVMTLWEFVPHKPPESAADMAAVAHALRQLHRALGEYDGPLPSFAVAIDVVGDVLADETRTPELAANSRAFLAKLHARLRDALRVHDYAPMPLHGDTHLGNVLMADTSAIWADLEAVCLGPREWDIVTLPETTWSGFGATDPALMRCLADLRSLCAAVWSWADYGRSSEVDEAADYHLGDLQARFAHLL